VFAQTYFSFPTDNATWTFVEYGNNFPTNSTGTSHYGINGDTLINSTTYHKLYVNQGGLGAINPESQFIAATATYYAAYREDANKKIWLIRDESSTEILYYDFALNQGDNFCFESQPSGLTCLVVDFVDDILINGANRRQIHFSYGGQNDVWIEGIGSISKDWSGIWSFVGNLSYDLNCYKENLTTLYGQCDYPTSIINSVSENDNISIYPNPALSKINIDLQLNSSDNLSLDIYSTMGIKVLSVIDFNSKTSVDISSLTSGQYVAVISNSMGNIWTKKIIKYAP